MTNRICFGNEWTQRFMIPNIPNDMPEPDHALMIAHGRGSRQGDHLMTGGKQGVRHALPDRSTAARNEDALFQRHDNTDLLTSTSPFPNLLCTRHFMPGELRHFVTEMEFPSPHRTTILPSSIDCTCPVRPIKR